MDKMEYYTRHSLRRRTSLEQTTSHFLSWVVPATAHPLQFLIIKSELRLSQKIRRHRFDISFEKSTSMVKKLNLKRYNQNKCQVSTRKTQVTVFLPTIAQLQVLPYLCWILSKSHSCLHRSKSNYIWLYWIVLPCVQITPPGFRAVFSSW